MKKLIIALMLMPALANAQKLFVVPEIPVDAATKKQTYAVAGEVPGATRAELYGRAFNWLAANMKWVNGVLNDKETGRIIFKEEVTYNVDYHQPITTTGLYVWNYTVKIQLNDGAYRVRVSDFYVDGLVAHPTLPFGEIDQLIKYITDYNIRLSGKDEYSQLNTTRAKATTSIVYLQDIDKRIKEELASFEQAMKTGKADDF